MKELETIYNKINNLNYLLDRKIQILSQILVITENQNIVFKGFNDDSINELINMSYDEKQSLINELVNIDSMFLEIFQSFSGSLNKNKYVFEQEIINIQNKIQQITDIDLKIRLQEEKNRQISINTSNYKGNNINQTTNNIDKVKILKMSKEEMLKKYNSNNKKF